MMKRLVAKVKNLVALVPVLGAISRPGITNKQILVNKIQHYYFWIPDLS